MQIYISSDFRMDSIKVIRGRKIFRKTTQKKDKKEETDSQHTQLIDVPLGKASGHVFWIDLSKFKMLNFRSDTGVSKLTATEEQKVVEKPNGKKIQFADKMVKSTITPGAKKWFKIIRWFSREIND